MMSYHQRWTVYHIGVAVAIVLAVIGALVMVGSSIVSGVHSLAQAPSETPSLDSRMRKEWQALGVQIKTAIDQINVAAGQQLQHNQPPQEFIEAFKRNLSAPQSVRAYVPSSP